MKSSILSGFPSISNAASLNAPSNSNQEALLKGNGYLPKGQPKLERIDNSIKSSVK